VHGTPAAIDAFGPSAARFASLAQALIGGVMAGWGPGLWLVMRTLIARSSKTGWRLVAVSLGARHVPGTAYSLAAGFGQNAVLSTFFTLVFAAPLALLCLARARGGLSRLRRQGQEGGVGGAQRAVR
jgi:hypothetical protein